jgi:flagellar protein FliO/FliZ
VLELTLRLVFSLTAVVGLMLLLARVAGRRMRGQSGAALQILHRQALSRSASVVVVSVGGRVLVLGTTDQQVRVLTEMEPEELGLTLDADLGAELDAGLDAGLGLALDAEDVPAPVTAPAPPRLTSVPRRGAGAHRATPAPVRPERVEGPLAGSVLSAQTWRQAFAAATRRAS